MDELTAAANVKWVETTVIKTHDNPPPESQWLYRIWLPDWLAKWDVFANWERERFASMEKELQEGDILFDIGAEVGWQSMIYAKFVGPENMVLIEPSAYFWPNIQHTWLRNFDDTPPLACYQGLFSDSTTNKTILAKHTFPNDGIGDLGVLMDYKYIHEHGLQVPQIKLDDYVELSGIVPDALTMDTEGAELLILKGAKNTLINNNLKVWVSIHPDLALKDYDYLAIEIHDFMQSCGYTGKHLANDHEQHWLFRKP